MNYRQRRRYTVNNRNNSIITIDNKKLINFASNDYLGLSCHPKVKCAFKNSAENDGLGSGASALISGYHNSHRVLEEKFAEFLNVPKVLLFNSGYHANIGVLSSLINRHDVTLSDKQCHASIIDGIRLSRSKRHRYVHCDMVELEKLLQKNQKNKWIVTESVFSMSGRISPIDQISKLAEEYQVALIIDDAHGIGVIGQDGRGVTSYSGILNNDKSCIIVPLGKALGSMGAVVAGSKDVIDFLINKARSYWYTTAMPAAVAAATVVSLDVMQSESSRREQLFENIHYFIELAKESGLELISKAFTPIKSIVVSDDRRAELLQSELMQQGFFVACIRPPTVPVDTARIRISLSCLHTKNDIKRLVDCYVGISSRICI